MDTQERNIWEIIGIVLNGTPTIEEQEAFDKWLNSDPNNIKIYQILIRNGNNHSNSFTKSDKEAVFLKIKKEMETKSKGRRLIKWSLSVAATILVLFTTFYTKSYIENNSRSSLMLESTTPYGVKSKITLPDGTLVYLNAGTTLKYPSHFSKQRVVNLTGEAYFEVFKDSKHPFWVETKGVKIKVLGTHFNVKAYENENSIETTLLEGSVGLYRGTVNDEVLVNILKPNQQAVLVKNSGEIKVNSIDANLVNAWKDGKFYFENMDFVGIAKVLERNYNVKIEIRSEELQKKKFFGIFLQNRSVYQMLDIMGIKEDFKYKRYRDTIYIY